MAKNDKVWHPDFIKYMEFIVNHPNYKGLPIKRKSDGSLAWIATAQSDIGKERIAWCERKAKELGFPIEAGVYARVMREIHPTKWKVCQTCGKKMSIYYHYPILLYKLLQIIAIHFKRSAIDITNIDVLNKTPALFLRKILLATNKKIRKHEISRSNTRFEESLIINLGAIFL